MLAPDSNGDEGLKGGVEVRLPHLRRRGPVHLQKSNSFKVYLCRFLNN